MRFSPSSSSSSARRCADTQERAHVVGGAVDGRDIMLLQQRQADIFVGVQLPTAGGGFTQASRDVREHVERPLRLVATDAFRCVQHLHRQIAPALVRHDLFIDAVLRPIQRCGGCRLSYG